MQGALGRLFSAASALLDPVFRWLLGLPWPWRPAVLLLGLELLIALLFWRVLPGAWRNLRPALRWFIRAVTALLLLVEYAITTLLRGVGRGPLPGTHLIGDALLWVRSRVTASQGVESPRRPLPDLPFITMLLVASLPVVLWFARPFARSEPSIGHIIDRGVAGLEWGERWIVTALTSSSSPPGSSQ